MTHEDKLTQLGIALPELPKPLGAYVPCVQTGNLLFLSGMLPLRNSRLTRTGKVGDSITIEEAQEDARQAGINALALLKSYLGTLNRVSQCVKINGYVASAEGFFDQPKVINPASELMVEVFGEAGRHARAALGVYTLPLGSPVEIDFIFEITD
ncbi:MAG: RidA family protein [Dissulfurispiraceae bacterium]|jgi:enamine deaminase RidA (YjgF/YER057c/UK114 family)|nr:RidA family protein [Dissulfurispiraceae bacterium]